MDAFVTRVIVTIEFVTRVENSFYVRQIRFSFHTSNDKSERTHKRCHAYVLVRSVQIPLKFKCRYITPSRALHLLTCMLVRSCWHKKSWSYFDSFNEVFNACFVCLFCLVNYKRKKTAMNSHYTIKESHPPTASQIQKIVFHRQLSSPESHSTSTPTQEPRWARPKTYHQDKPN